MKHAYTSTIFALSFLLCSHALLAQSTLKLRSGSFILPQSDSKQLLPDEVSTWPSDAGHSYGIVELAQMPTLEDRASLEENGITILEFLQGRSFLISVRTGAMLNSLNAFGVVAVNGWQPEMKFIGKETAPAIAKSSGDKVLVNLHYFPVSGKERLKGMLPSGATLVDERPTYGFITVETVAQKVNELTALSSVKFIDWKYDYGEAENYTSRTGHRINYLSPENTNGLNYDGSGINVMLQDDGFIGPHVDFQGRILAQYWQPSLGDHGDHVGGTIAGAGNINPYTEGQAKGANLYVYKAAPEYQGFDSIDIHYNTKDVLITSTSYSNGCNAGYTALAQEMDDQVFNMESLMHVFSAGNSGTSDCGYGASAVWGNITGGHKIGKNVIAVGNLLETDVISNSSSRGPAADGRLKPDLCTKGTSVYSTTDPNDYTTKSGTSMSCPGVSGAMAVLYEAYQDINGTLPPAGLAKAAMLNTSDDLGNVGPDFIYGWGRLNARKAYETFNNNYIITGSITDQGNNQHTITVPSDIARLKVMVYWTDPEASVGSTINLVNDLDMTMTDPSNNTHLRWTLDPTPNDVNLSTPAAEGPDHLNNMEQIVIDNPASGSYTINLNGFNVPVGPQEYFLVYWLEPKEITITYPAGGESYTPFVDEFIRWDAPATSGTYTIEYTEDGITWFTLSTAVPGDASHYDWGNVPNVTTPDARVRITDSQSGLTATSEPFHIMRTPTGLTVDYSCPDSIGLSWNSLNVADEFDVYQLGVKYMDVIGTSPINEFVDYNSNPFSDDVWYSVSARNNNGAKGKRANAINKPGGIFNCILPLDLGLDAMIPNGGAFYGCHSDTGYAIGFTVSNSGTTPISSFVADLTSAGGQSMTETYTASIAPGASADFFFPTNLNITGSIEEVSIVISLIGDANVYNDTIVAYFEEINEPAVLPQWREDFETFNSCSTESTCELVVCDLIDGWHNEENTLVDDIDWRVNNGDTPSDQTGPSFDHNPGTAAGNYLYLEASGNCTFQTALVVSPCIDLVMAQSAELTFWFHMFGSEMGTLSVDVFDGQQWNLDAMPILSGNEGNVWQPVTVDLSSFVGNVINIRFRGTIGNGFRSDMAIDDISVLAPPVANFSFTINQPTDVLYTDLSVYADTMAFSLGDGVTLDSVPGVYTYAQITSYIVQQIVSNEVASDTAIQIIQGLGINDLQANGINLFPNPASESFVIEQQKTALNSVRIYDSSGKLVEAYGAPTTLREHYDVSHLKPGLYMIRLSGESEVVTPLSIVR